MEGKAFCFTFVPGGDNEFVVSIVVVRVELLIVDYDPARVHAEVVVRHQILYFRVRAGIRVGRFHFQYTRPQRYILVHVMGLVVGQLEFRRIVIHVGNSYRQLERVERENFNLSNFIISTNIFIIFLSRISSQFSFID